MRVVDLATPDTSSTITYQAGQEFQPGTRRVVAQGILCGHHRNVAFLSISPGRLDRLLSFLRFLPAPLRAIVQSRWPEWFLPPKIVLKRQKLGWDEEFDNEKSIYQRLAPLQGTVVPVFYGEASCPATEDTGTRALVFSHVDGIGLYEEAAGGMEREEVRSMLMASLLAMSSLGVIHDDYKLDNFVLVGD
ncbi:hypothetical protein B0T18DRAFT_322209 [Schizothecium vesticola]|uniref:Protein kinase domain-containing protein n=1 Tax=Schizothecium vesticola TaxID=314040 RepID=A0AA40F2Q7_9PEZI|nr:hypothetical protein B0T18DRAFT_322209 [Schizothecium vesticola]